MGELANKIRAKYPGAYDALDDDTLEAKIVAKYPQYKSLAAKTPALEPPTTKEPEMGWGERLLTGIGGGMYGAGLGVAQTAAELGEKVGVVSPETTQGLRQSEVERRQVMDRLKSEGGGRAGIMNPASIGEFVGEMLPTAVIPGGAAKTLGQAAKLGVVTGGVQGAMAPLVPEEDRLASTAKGVVAGAMLGPAAYGVTKTVKAVPGMVKGAGEFSSDIGERIFKPDQYANKAAARQLTTAGRKFAPIPLSETKSLAAREKALANRDEAIMKLATMRDMYVLPDRSGNAVNRLPNTRGEVLDATNQVLPQLLSHAEKAEQALTSSGYRVPLSESINELSKVTKAKYGTERYNQAQRLIAELEEINSAGGMRPSDAMTRMKVLNNQIKAAYSGANMSGESAEVLGLFANKLRKALNESIDDNVAGAEFAKVRRDWGKIHSLEEDALREFEKEAAKEARGASSVYDILGIEQLGSGVITLNPNQVKRAIASFSSGRVMGALNSKDRAVKKAFRAADILTKEQGPYRLGEIIPPPPKTTYFDPTVGAEVPIRDSQVPYSGPQRAGGTSTKESYSREASKKDITFSIKKIADQYGITVEEALRRIEAGE